MRPPIILILAGNGCLIDKSNFPKVYDTQKKHTAQAYDRREDPHRKCLDHRAGWIGSTRLENLIVSKLYKIFVQLSRERLGENVLYRL